RLAHLGTGVSGDQSGKGGSMEVEAADLIPNQPEVGEGSLLATHHHRGGRLVPLVVALLEVTRRPFGYRMSVRHHVGPRRIHRGLSPRVPRPGLEPGLIVGRVCLLGTSCTLIHLLLT